MNVQQTLMQMSFLDYFKYNHPDVTWADNYQLRKITILKFCRKSTVFLLTPGEKFYTILLQ